MCQVFDKSIRDFGHDCRREALDDTLRAQENVVEFAKEASFHRSSIYRSFSPNKDPQFSTVVHFLRALGLRFAVVSLSPLRN